MPPVSVGGLSTEVNIETSASDGHNILSVREGARGQTVIRAKSFCRRGGEGQKV